MTILGNPQKELLRVSGEISSDPLEDSLKGTLRETLSTNFREIPGRGHLEIFPERTAGGIPRKKNVEESEGTTGGISRGKSWRNFLQKLPFKS